MYVALTRARRRLYLSFAQSRMLHGQTRYGIASRFFQEIPDALMKRVNFSHGSRVTSHGSQGSGHGSRVSSHGSAVNDSRLATRDAQTDSPWRVGQSVVHSKFGAGVIVNAEGRGADARVQVNFRDGGLKWLMLEYAKLAPA